MRGMPLKTASPSFTEMLAMVPGACGLTSATMSGPIVPSQVTVAAYVPAVSVTVRYSWGVLTCPVNSCANRNAAPPKMTSAAMTIPPTMNIVWRLSFF